MAATTSSNCSSFFNFRAAGGHSKVRNSSSFSGQSGCRKVDGVAMWLINGVTTAFFASLERCSCIRVTTVEDDGEDMNEMPLIFNDDDTTHAQKVSGIRRRCLRGKKKAGTYATVD
ncbi:hypothetical protein SOVF_003070 [Spinacia oleracea]|uniref:Uncharacterized protein n=1 Tax=Spinacia oleracea TaxID=3562 RepID=A0A9R0I204_SPIOL|nr:uncharacterized protein LOC110781214 [Spinacia oleracea]KNA25817.1 hypothetical protein SOVF_003070 [Spinacia oleracea]